MTPRAYEEFQLLASDSWNCLDPNVDGAALRGLRYVGTVAETIGQYVIDFEPYMVAVIPSGQRALYLTVTGELSKRFEDAALYTYAAAKATALVLKTDGNRTRAESLRDNCSLDEDLFYDLCLRDRQRTGEAFRPLCAAIDKAEEGSKVGREEVGK